MEAIEELAIYLADFSISEHKVENGELDMLGYVMLNPELKEPFSDYARGNGITCPTAADAVRFLKEYEERLYQELLP